MYNVIAGTTKGLGNKDNNWIFEIAVECALLIDVESPTCPIFWQLFFVLYLTRAGNPPRFFAHTLIDANKKECVLTHLRFYV
mgnify:CR=1 FL=1